MDSYNKLPDDLQQPALLDSHIRDLADLFVRNRAHEIFGIHLVHGHFTIPTNTVLLGTNYSQPRCRWAKTTPIPLVDLDCVHGHIFVLSDHEFHPYEYQMGRMPDLSQVGSTFLTELANYLELNNLTMLVGLQVIEPNASPMFELVLPMGTVMVDVTNVNGCVPTRHTGWQFQVINGESRVCTPYETHARHANGHDIFNAGAPHPKLETFQDVKHALQQQNILCC